MITSLHISQWIEPSTSDSGFRSCVVPKGVTIDYWDGMNLDCEQLMKTWHKKAEERGSDIFKSAISCEFLIEAYRILVLHGSRVFYLFCSESLNNQSQLSRTEDIQLLILQNEHLSEVVLKVQEYFSYNIDSSFNICFHERSLNSHVKYRKLRDTVTHYINQGSVCGIVLCESALVSRAVAESINNAKLYQIINIVESDLDIPSVYKHFHRPISRISGIFMQTSSIIVILNVSLQGVYYALDTLCSNRLQFVLAVDRRSLCFLENHTGDHIAILSEKYEKLMSVAEYAKYAARLEQLPVPSRGIFSKKLLCLKMSLSVLKIYFVIFTEDVDLHAILTTEVKLVRVPQCPAECTRIQTYVGLTYFRVWYQGKQTLIWWKNFSSDSTKHGTFTLKSRCISALVYIYN
uniref:Ssl1 domain-containing protein n=1 Tax=Heterorhabditis bacteriophora TaxID=37862 RepID=A0A1I7X224_HETBA